MTRHLLLASSAGSARHRRAWSGHSTHPRAAAEITVGLDKAVIAAADGIQGNLRSLFLRVQAKPE